MDAQHVFERCYIIFLFYKIRIVKSNHCCLALPTREVTVLVGGTNKLVVSLYLVKFCCQTFCMPVSLEMSLSLMN